MIAPGQAALLALAAILVPVAALAIFGLWLRHREYALIYLGLGAALVVLSPLLLAYGLYRFLFRLPPKPALELDPFEDLEDDRPVEDGRSLVGEPLESHEDFIARLDAQAERAIERIRGGDATVVVPGSVPVPRIASRLRPTPGRVKPAVVRTPREIEEKIRDIRRHDLPLMQKAIHEAIERSADPAYAAPAAVVKRRDGIRKSLERDVREIEKMLRKAQRFADNLRAKLIAPGKSRWLDSEDCHPECEIPWDVQHRHLALRFAFAANQSRAMLPAPDLAVRLLRGNVLPIVTKIAKFAPEVATHVDDAAVFVRLIDEIPACVRYAPRRFSGLVDPDPRRVIRAARRLGCEIPACRRHDVQAVVNAQWAERAMDKLLKRAQPRTRSGDEQLARSGL